MTRPPPAAEAPDLALGSLAMPLLGALCVTVVVVFRRNILNRGALADRAAAAATVSPVHWLTAGFAGWFVWAFSLPLFGSLLPGEPAPSLPAQAWASTPAYALGVCALFAALWPVRRTPAFRAFGPDWRDAPRGVAGALLGIPAILAVGFLAAMLASLIARATGGAPPEQIAHTTLKEILTLRAERGLSWWLLPIAIQVLVLAPLLEELVYRGCLQSAFVSATGRTWASIGAASAVFALVHVSAAPWHAMPALFGVGAVCGIVFERTGRIGPAVVVHALFNALNLFAALAGTFESAPGAPSS